MPADPLRVFQIVGRVVLIGTLVPALLVVGGFVWSLIYTRHYMAALTATATGHVTRLVDTGDGNQKIEFEFDDAQGTHHVARTAWASSPPAYDVGDAVHVMYDPTGRREPTLDMWFVNYLLPFVIGVFAGVGVAVWVVLAGIYVGTSIVWKHSRRRAGGTPTVEPTPPAASLEQVED